MGPVIPYPRENCRRPVGRILREAARGGLPVRLHILRVNPARELYERMGFRPTGGDEYRGFMEATPVIGDNPQGSIGEC